MLVEEYQEGPEGWLNILTKKIRRGEIIPELTENGHTIKIVLDPSHVICVEEDSVSNFYLMLVKEGNKRLELFIPRGMKEYYKLYSRVVQFFRFIRYYSLAPASVQEVLAEFYKLIEKEQYVSNPRE